MQYMAAVNLGALTNLGVDKFPVFSHHTCVFTAAEMAIQAPDRGGRLDLERRHLCDPQRDEAL